MFKTNILKGGGGLPISVDSRGGSVAGASYIDVHGNENYLSRDSIMDAQDARDSIFLNKKTNKTSWINKKVLCRFSSLKIN